MGGGEAILAAGGAALKGVKVDDKITEYGVQKDAKTVRRCKSEQRPPEGCEGGKVEARGQSTEYRLQRRQQRGMVGWSIEYRGMPKRKGDSAKVSASRARPKGAKVEIGRRPVQKCKGG